MVVLGAMTVCGVTVLVRLAYFIIVGMSGKVIMNDTPEIHQFCTTFWGKVKTARSKEDLREAAQAAADFLCTLIEFWTAVGAIYGAVRGNAQLSKAQADLALQKARVTQEESPRSPTEEWLATPPGSAKPFDGIPSFANRSPKKPRDWLMGNGFTRKTIVRQAQYSPDGSLAKDFQSEIWIRFRVECVRVDPVGHIKKAATSRTDGRVPMDGAKGERLGHGNVPHYHLETIPQNEAATYLNTQVRDVTSYDSTGKSVSQILAEIASSTKNARQPTKATIYNPQTGKSKVSQRPREEVPPAPSKWSIQHIPLALE